MKKITKTSAYKLISFSLILSGLNFCGTAFAYRENIPQEVEQAQNSIVKIHTRNLNGTGIITSPDTLVTNFHVVVNEEGILPIETFRLSNGSKLYKKVKVTGVKALSPADDLAILEITNYEGKTIKLSDFETTAKEVYMLGFTNGALRIITGEIKNKTDKDYRIRPFGSMPYKLGFFPHYPGMSGGPVLDAKGHLIAVIKSGEIVLLRASTSESLRALFRQSSSVSSNGKDLFHTTMEELKQRAKQGDPLAQLTLGNMYKKGTGVSKNLKKAHKWIKKAAEQGLAHAQLTLGLNKSIENDTEAWRWMKKAAEQGLPQAQFTLGFIYYAEKNYEEAYKWIKKAAEQGIPQAQLLLGHIHQRGQSVPKNYIEAYELIQKAAEQGIPLAKYYLRFISVNRWLRNTTKKAVRCLNVFD